MITIVILIIFIVNITVIIMLCVRHISGEYSLVPGLGLPRPMRFLDQVGDLQVGRLKPGNTQTWTQTKRQTKTQTGTGTDILSVKICLIFFDLIMKDPCE